jgi:hypothetical protein
VDNSDLLDKLCGSNIDRLPVPINYYTEIMQFILSTRIIVQLSGHVVGV